MQRDNALNLFKIPVTYFDKPKIFMKLFGLPEPLQHDGEKHLYFLYMIFKVTKLPERSA
jgi:hypothetical protein